MSDIYSVSVQTGRDITTVLCRNFKEAEAVLRENYDQEPADYADLNLDDLIEALECRDGLNIVIQVHPTHVFIMPGGKNPLALPPPKEGPLSVAEQVIADFRNGVSIVKEK